MRPIILQLKQDPAFRQLSVGAQIEVAAIKLREELAKDPDFASLNPGAQDIVIRQEALRAPTLATGQLEAVMNATGAGLYLGANGAVGSKQAYELWNSVVQSSGIAGGLERIMQGEQTKTIQEDRRRTLEYYKIADRMAHRSDPASEVGSVLGFLGDIFAVNLIMAPLTGGASTAIQASARGTTTAAYKAGLAAVKAAATPVAKRAAMNALPAVLKPALSFYGPIAAETLIEAVPYMLVEEQRRVQQGQTSVFSEGIGAVAKTLGINAASDFIVGTAAAGLLRLASKSMKSIFRKTPIYKDVANSEEEFATLVKQMRTGVIQPEVIANMTPFDQDRLAQGLLNARFLDEGASAPDLYPVERAAHYAVHHGIVWGATKEAAEDGSERTIYRLWEMADNGRPMERKLGSFLDVENHIAYKSYEAYSKLAPDAQVEYMKSGKGYLLERGKRLYENSQILDVSDVAKADPVLWATANSRTVPSPRKRIVMTKAEADALATPGSPIVAVQAQIDLRGDVVKNANAGDFNLLRGTGVTRVTQSDTPNIVILGTKQATIDEYIALTEKAKRIVEVNPTLSLEEARAGAALDAGIDHFRHPDGSVEFFSNRTMRLIGTPEDVLYKAKKPVAVGSVSGRVIVEESAEAVAMAKQLKGKGKILADAATSVVRSGKVEDYNSFVKMYLASQGIDIPVSVEAIDGDISSVLISQGKATLYAPKAPVTFDEEKKAVSRLLTSLSSLSDFSGSKKALATASPDYWASKINVKRVPLTFSIPASNKQEFLRLATQKLGGTVTAVGTDIRIDLPSGSKLVQSLDAAVDWVGVRTLDQAAISNDLLRQGVKLTTAPNGDVVARTLREGKLLSTGELYKVLEDIHYTPSSLDITYGPRVLSMTPDGLKLDFHGVTTFRNQADMQQFMAKFKDHAFMNNSLNVLSKGSGAIDFTPNGAYRVRLTKYNYVKDFDTLGEARRFIENPPKDLDSLADIANKKMLDLYMDNGEYVITATDTVYRVKTVEDVAEVFRKYPDIEESAPKILDELDPTIEQSVQDIVMHQKGLKRRAGLNPRNLPPEWPDQAPPTALSTYMQARAITSGMNAYIEDVAQRANIPELRKLYLQVEAGRRLAEVNTSRGHHLLNFVFKGENGKIVNKASRQRIYYHLAATSTEDASALAAQYRQRHGVDLAPLTWEEEVIANRVKQYLGSLSEKFRIDADKLLFHYMPRLREIMDNPTTRGLYANVMMADDLAKRAGIGDMPEIKFWAENERVDEIARFWVKDDALEVLMLYTSQGNKRLYMNEAWKQLHRYAEETGIERSIVNRLEMYRANLMGSYHTPAERQIEEFGSSLFATLGSSKLIQNVFKKTPSEMAEMGKGIMNSALGVTYFSTMGWKPFLAIRNAMQPLITLSPRFGLGWTLKAWNDIFDLGDDYITKLRQLGVISEKPPIVNQVFGSNTRFSKFAEKSMTWFKNADDMTRAIAYRTAEIRFDNAYKALAHGQIATKAQFDALSGLDVMDPVLGQRVWESVTKKGRKIEDMVAARHAFGYQVSEETMFGYRGSEAPMMFNGVVGKLFGQYGSYATGYRANLARMFKYGSISKRAEMVATYLAITGALWGTFEALKIKTNDFIPVMPSVFTGGVGFDVAVSAVKAMDVTGYEGDQARAKLKAELPRLLPGSAQYRYITKALDYYDQGNHYAAVLSLHGVPYLE